MSTQEEESPDTIVSAIQDLTGTVDHRLKELLKKMGGEGGSTGDWDIPEAAKQAPEEEVLVRYTVGAGKFDAKKHYNYLKMKMYRMDGTRDGSHDGVWQPQFMPLDLYEVPPEPRGPLNKPEGPVDPIPVRAWTKAVWKFGAEEKDSVTAVGPANLLLVPLQGERTVFLVSVAAIITNGTGKYEGARGVKTALGSTLVEGNWESMFALPPEKTFKACTIETFRIIPADKLGDYPDE